MGIRLHKKLGWGLNDVVADDPRIDVTAVHAAWDADVEVFHDHLAALDVEDGGDHDVDLDVRLPRQFLQWDLERYHTIRKLLKDGTCKTGQLPTVRKPEFYTAISFRDEGGLPNVFHIMPLTHTKDWSRYADAIDYAEHDLKYGLDSDDYMDSTAQLLPTAPWPYSGLYMDSRTGQGLPPQKTSLWMRNKNSGFLTVYPDRAEELTQELLDMSVADALQYVVPQIPSEIYHMLQWSKIFSDESTWLDLRPMLYTYWS